MKEHNLRFNLSQGNFDGKIDKVKGHLDCIIVKSDGELEITVESSNGYLILQNSQHEGVRYYAPRAVLQGTNSKLNVSDQFEKFLLNETLIFLVSGPKSGDVEIIIRIDD